LSVLGYPRPEPITNQANYPWVGNPVLDKTLHPFMVDGIEKALDVCVEYPVHFSAGQTNKQGV